MIKLMGSKKAKVECIECGEISQPFRIWLYAEDGEQLFNLKDDGLPKDWEIEDEAELEGDLINGYCPKHKPV